MSKEMIERLRADAESTDDIGLCADAADRIEELERKDLIKSMGFTILAVEQGRHYKYRLTTPQGKKMLITSVTASDHRALQNIAKQLRSWL